MLSARASDYGRALVLVLLLTGSLLPSVGSLSLTLPAAVLASILLGAEVLRSLPRIPAGMGFGLVLFGVLAASLLWTPDPLLTYGEEKIGRLFGVTLLGALAAVVIRGQLLAFARVWLVVGVVLAAGALTGISDAAGRSTGLEESNPIWLARAIGTGLVVAVWLWSAGRLRGQWAVSLVAFLMAGVFATGSRGPLLGAAVGVAVVLLALWRVRGAYLLAWLAAFATAALWWSSALRSSRVGSALLSPGGDVNARVRQQLWEDSVDVIAANPGGVGFGNWTAEVRALPLVYPHNLFLEVAAEAGWVAGGVVLVALLVVVLRLVRRSTTPMCALVLAMLAAETVAVSVSGDMNARTWWFLLVLGWAAGRSADPDELDIPGPTRTARAAGATRSPAAPTASTAGAVR